VVLVLIPLSRRGGKELLAGRAGQPQGVGEQPDRTPVREALAAFQVADRLRAQPGHLGQLLLGQRGGQAELPQQIAERNASRSSLARAHMPPK
jgi:hypothetical protein